jgi:hypothetical protein
LPLAGIKAEDRHLKSNKIISDNSEGDLSKHPKELTDVMVALELGVWDYRRSSTSSRLQICGDFCRSDKAR